MATSTGPRKIIELPGEELAALIGLISGSDSVELKVTLPEEAQRSAIAALGLDPLEAQIRQVFFFDTPELTLNQAGIAVRARRSQGKSGDTVVKLGRSSRRSCRRTSGLSQPQGRGRRDARRLCLLRLDEGARVERGRRALVAGRAASASCSRRSSARTTRPTLPEGLVLDDLRVLGPIFVLKLVTVPAELGRKLTAEMWLLPDGSRILELSTKCLPAEAFQVAVETRRTWRGSASDLSGETQTKTKTALELLSAELGGEDVGVA
jgi:hypothetical protein